MKELTMKDLYFKSPATLYFRHSTMVGGKSTNLITTAHNYRVENEDYIVVMKPKVDTKANDNIISRVSDNLVLKADYLITEGKSITHYIRLQMIEAFSKHNTKIACILVDEAQFLTKKQVEELVYIANVIGIPTICYGLRTDFKGELFEGSKWLMAWAQKIEEMQTRPMSAIGHKNKKATMNLRKINGKPVFEGEQIEIDNGDKVEYLPVTMNDHLYQRKLVGEYDFGTANSFTFKDFLEELLKEEL